MMNTYVCMGLPVDNVMLFLFFDFSVYHSIGSLFGLREVIGEVASLPDVSHAIECIATV